MNSLELINRIQQDLSRALSGLDQIKQQLMAANNAQFIPAPEPMELREFGQLLWETLNQHFSNERDFTDETYQRLHTLSHGDGETVAIWLEQISKRKSEPESLGGYAVAVLKKIGIETLRAEQYSRGQRGEVPPSLDDDPTVLTQLPTGLSSEATTELISRIQRSQRAQAAQGETDE